MEIDFTLSVLVTGHSGLLIWAGRYWVHISVPALNQSGCLKIKLVDIRTLTKTISLT